MFDGRAERERVLAGVEEGGGGDAVVVRGDMRGVDEDRARWWGHVVARVLGQGEGRGVSRVLQAC